MAKIRARKRGSPVGPKLVVYAQGKYNPMQNYKVYRMIREEGLGYRDVAQRLEISHKTFLNWLGKYPQLKQIVEDAKSVDGGLDLANFVYRRLDPRLKTLWDDLEKCESDDADEMIEALLANRGKVARQYLFIYAWVRSNFSISKALRKVNISKTTFDLWCRDETFQKLVAEIHWHKKNFFEDALLQCVRRGETAAVIFANKTANRDRGYNERVEIAIAGEVSHVVTPISDLNLSLGARREMLAEMRRRKQPKLKDATTGEAIDE